MKKIQSDGQQDYLTVLHHSSEMQGEPFGGCWNSLEECGFNPGQPLKDWRKEGVAESPTPLTAILWWEICLPYSWVLRSSGNWGPVSRACAHLPPSAHLSGRVSFSSQPLPAPQSRALDCSLPHLDTHLPPSCPSTSCLSHFPLVFLHF